VARLQLNRGAVERTATSAAVSLVSRAMRGTENRAKQLVGVKTGETRASIQSGFTRVSRNGVTGRVGSRLAKAHYYHEGTRAHIIRPKRKKALRFVSDGTVYVRALVHHPGIGSTPFLTTALFEVAVPLGFRVERFPPARLMPREGTLTP